MAQGSIVLTASAEKVAAKLTDAAYQVVLRRGLSAPFIDVELELWRALSATLADLLVPAEEPARLRPVTVRNAPQFTRADLIDIRDRLERLSSPGGERNGLIV